MRDSAENAVSRMEKDISSSQFKRETSSDENVSKCINRQQKHRDAKQQKY